MPRALHNSSHLIDELRSDCNKRVACPKDRQCVLSVLTSVVNRRQQLHINSTEAGQQFGIDLVALSLVFTDEPKASWVCDEHLVSMLLDKA